jgi:tetratricopeptide (TPR) repeat protein
MESLGQARTKAGCGASWRLAWVLLLAAACLTVGAFSANAQQPARNNQPRTPAQSPVIKTPGVQSQPRTQTLPSNSPSGRPATPAAAAQSNDPQQLLAAGQTALDQNRFDDAVRLYNRVIALSANKPQTAAIANLKIGNSYMVQRKFENAVFGFERAIQLNPNYAEAYNNLGEAVGELKQYSRAIEMFGKAAALDPALLKAKYNQAVSYDRMRNFRYSEFVFRNLIKSNPNYSLAYDGLAVTLSKAGRGKEAIAFHEKAIALAPNDPSYYFNLAISYLMLGNTAKASEQQEKLKLIDPLIADRLANVIVKRQM